MKVIESLRRWIRFPAHIVTRVRRYKKRPEDAWARMEWKTRRDALHELKRTPGKASSFLDHYSGYVREAALDVLIDRPDLPVSLWQITLRLNDWVIPVRSKAVVLEVRRLPMASHEDFAALLPKRALDMLSWQRSGRHSVFLRYFSDTPAGNAAIVDWLTDARQGPATPLLYALLARPEIDSSLNDLALRSNHPGCRRIATKALLSGEAVWPVGSERVWIDKSLGVQRTRTVTQSRPLTVSVPHAPLLLAAAGDRNAKVRRIAADHLIADGPSALPPEARILLEADTDIGVRERIDFAERKWHL